MNPWAARPGAAQASMILWKVVGGVALFTEGAWVIYKLGIGRDPGDPQRMKGRIAGVRLLIPAAIILLMAHTVRSQSRSSAAKRSVEEQRGRKGAKRLP